MKKLLKFVIGLACQQSVVGSYALAAPPGPWLYTPAAVNGKLYLVSIFNEAPDLARGLSPLRPKSNNRGQ